jgi:hypothetical protein
MPLMPIKCLHPGTRHPHLYDANKQVEIGCLDKDEIVTLSLGSPITVIWKEAEK